MRDEGWEWGTMREAGWWGSFPPQIPSEKGVLSLFSLSSLYFPLSPSLSLLLLKMRSLGKLRGGGSLVDSCRMHTLVHNQPVSR